LLFLSGPVHPEVVGDFAGLPAPSDELWQAWKTK
jgi:hypothetical protein